MKSRITLIDFLLFCAAALIAAGPVAAAPPTVTLTWTVPTTNTDGTPITGAITYNIFQGAGTASSCTPGATAVQTGVTATSATITTGLADGTTACFAVTAVVGGVSSADSNTVSKTFPAATPMAPVLSAS